MREGPRWSSHSSFKSTHRKLRTRTYFGPTKPREVKDGNWIQTVRGKGWNVILRLYSPLEPFFTKAWRPSEIELVK